MSGYRKPNRPGKYIGEIVRRDQLGTAGRGRVAWLRCFLCDEPRWTDAKRPAKKCQVCSGKRRVATVDLNAFEHDAKCACLRCQAQRGETIGEGNPMWNGGRSMHSDGYVYITTGPNEKTLEHRLVAEDLLGRPLRDDEVVHHRNGVRDDNRPENLQVMTQSEHVTLHNHLRYATEAKA